MRKVVSILKSFNLFGAGAIVLVAVVMMAFKPEAKRQGVEWVQTSAGVWEQLNGRDYLCDQSENTCSASFPENQDPNQDSSGGTVIRDDGYATIAE